MRNMPVLKKRTPRTLEKALGATVALLAILLFVGKSISSHLIDDPRVHEAREAVAWNSKWIPDEQNAATDYVNAANAVHVGYSLDSLNIFINGELIPAVRVPLPPRIGNALADYVRMNSGALFYLEQAVGKSACRFPREGEYYRARYGEPLGSRIYRLPFLLTIATLSAADSGDHALAARNLNTMAALARSLIQDTSSGFHLSGSYVVTQLVDAFERTAPASAYSDEGLARVLRTLSDIEFLLPSRERLQQTLLSTLEWRIMGVEEGWARDSYVLPLLFSEWSGLDDFRRATCVFTGQDVLNAHHALDLTRIEQDLRYRRLYAGSGASNLVEVAQMQFRDLARVRALKGAVAVERFRLANNRLPESLEEVSRDSLGAITDPFSRGPMPYRKDERGYCVYSVGGNFVDDGGNVKPSSRHENSDIGVYICLAPTPPSLEETPPTLDSSASEPKPVRPSGAAMPGRGIPGGRPMQP